MTRRDAVVQLARATFTEMPEPEVRSCKVVKVLQVEHLVGMGTMGSVCRMVREYWTLDGKLIAREDPEA